MTAGLVAVPCRPDHARHVDFFRGFLQLAVPDGSIKQLYPGFFPHNNRNAAVREALDLGLAWVFFLDDDQLLHPDSLTRLLAHDRDVVSCNLLSKDAPFMPYLFFATNAVGAGYADTLDRKGRGVVEVAACGLGGVLVKTDVFRALPEPWFAVDQHLKTDDLYFCREAKKAGYAIHCDLDVLSGHIVNASVWPEWDPITRKWRTAIVVNNGATFYVPAAAKNKQYREWEDRERKKARG